MFTCISLNVNVLLFGANENFTIGCLDMVASKFK